MAQIKKIWNALIYGDKKTQRTIIAIIVLFAIAIVFTIYTITGGGAIFGLIAAFAAIMALLYMSSVKFGGTGKYVGGKNNSKPGGSQQSAKKKDGSANDTEDKTEKTEAERAADHLQNITASEIKQVLVSNKAPKNHLPIMIDSSKKYAISQTPAFIWTQKGNLEILVLEERARKLNIPLNTVTTIRYKPGVIASRYSEYEPFQTQTFASLTFGALLPSYYDDATGTKKNLYVIDPDIEVTNTSVYALMTTLQADVEIIDRIMTSDRYTEYYKQAHKTHVLWKDGVYDTANFKEAIKHMLAVMAESKISDSEFSENIRQMIAGRLITSEYADYYIAYRKKVASKGGKNA